MGGTGIVRSPTVTCKSQDIVLHKYISHYLIIVSDLTEEIFDIVNAVFYKIVFVYDVFMLTYRIICTAELILMSNTCVIDLIDITIFNDKTVA